MTDIAFDVIPKIAPAQPMEEGRWVDIYFPDRETGTPLFAGGDKSKPVRVKVRSRRCKAYRAQQIRNQASGISSNRKAKGEIEQDAALAANISTAAQRNFAVLAVCFDNFSSSQPGMLTPDDAFKTAIADENSYQFVVDQVWTASGDDAAFGLEPPPPPPKPLEGAEAGEAKPA